MGLKREIIRFSRAVYEKHSQIPTVGQIISAFKITRTEFYGVFTGLTELCRMAGIPIPEARINKTQAASIIRSQTTIQAATRPRLSIELNDEQTRRVLAISHLEGGVAPSVVLDKLLDRDTLMRDRHELDFDQVEQVARIVSNARKRGYPTSLLLSVMLAADRVGLTRINVGEANYIISTLQDLRTLGFDHRQVTESLSTLRKLGFFHLKEEDCRQLIEWFKWAHQQTLGNISLMPEYMKEASSILGPYFQYRKGDITLEAFLKEINAFL